MIDIDRGDSPDAPVASPSFYGTRLRTPFTITPSRRLIGFRNVRRQDVVDARGASRCAAGYVDESGGHAARTYCLRTHVRTRSLMRLSRKARSDDESDLRFAGSAAKTLDIGDVVRAVLGALCSDELRAIVRQISSCFDGRRRLRELDDDFASVVGGSYSDHGGGLLQPCCAIDKVPRKDSIYGGLSVHALAIVFQVTLDGNP